MPAARESELEALRLGSVVACLWRSELPELQVFDAARFPLHLPLCLLRPAPRGIVFYILWHSELPELQVREASVYPSFCSADEACNGRSPSKIGPRANARTHTPSVITLTHNPPTSNEGYVSTCVSAVAKHQPDYESHCCVYCIAPCCRKNTKDSSKLLTSRSPKMRLFVLLQTGGKALLWLYKMRGASSSRNCPTLVDGVKA